MTAGPAPLRRRNRLPSGTAIGAALVAALLGAALLSWLWTPHSPYLLDIPHRLQPPGARHWLGTDSLGRDVLSLLLAGAGNAIVAGVLAVGIGAVIGSAAGLLAAARGGWVEQAVLRAADFTFAFPALLSAILLAAAYGPGLATSITAIGIFNIPVFARVARAAARSVWAADYVQAARAAGRNGWQITWAHVLPNCAGALIVQATIQFAGAILAEAALSYLGLGTQPPQPSWGRMLNDAQTLLYTAPLLALWPGLAIAFSVLGLNLLGDGLGDRLDPKLARRR